MEERQRNRSGNSSRNASRNSSRESSRPTRSYSESRPSNRSRRQESTSILEWISDHFQYILLAIVAIIIIIAIIFVVRAVANRKAGNQGETAVHPITEEQKAAAAAEAGSVTITPSEKLVKADTSIQELVSSYLIAMAAGDVAKVESVSESVSDETKAYIRNGHSAMGYTNINVYQYPGTNEGEYVTVATFYYTERASGKVMPGISAFYILTAQDGSYKIASGTTMERNRSTVNEVLGIPEVEQLVIDTNTAIEAAKKAAAAQPTTTAAPDKEAGAA